MSKARPRKEQMFFMIPKNPDEETDKEILRKKIEKDTEHFLKFKENEIEQIPIGASSLTYGLNKKEAERLGKKKDDF